MLQEPATARRRRFEETALPLMPSVYRVARRPARRPDDIVSAVRRDYADARSGRLPLDLRATDTAELEAHFARAGLGFRARVIDLGMMGYRITGARVHRKTDRSSALFVYTGASDRILVCQMYPGVVTALRSPLEIRSHRGFDFYIYRRDEVTIVFWQEGELVCVLAGDFDPEQVIGLAFEKAMA